MKSITAVLANAQARAYRHVGVALSNEVTSMPVGRVCLANESLLVSTTYIEELTAWGIGYAGAATNQLKRLRDFLMPTRSGTARTVRITQYDEVEPFATVDFTKVKRSILGDFAEVRQLNASKVDRLILNRGLSVRLDLDELKDKPDWQQTHAAWLIDLLMRASVLEGLALFQASATVINTTWDAAANPDMEIKGEGITLANTSGFHPNRGIYGDTAAFKRQQSYDNQLTAGSLSRSQMMTDEQIAVSTGLDAALTNADRYQSSSAAKSEIVGSNVLLFTGVDGETPQDPSNLVRHTASASYGGGEYAAYVTPLGVKNVILTVENYELLALQHGTGIAQVQIA